MHPTLAFLAMLAALTGLPASAQEPVDTALAQTVTDAIVKLARFGDEDNLLALGDELKLAGLVDKVIWSGPSNGDASSRRFDARYSPSESAFDIGMLVVSWEQRDLSNGQPGWFTSLRLDLAREACPTVQTLAAASHLKPLQGPAPVMDGGPPSAARMTGLVIPLTNGDTSSISVMGDNGCSVYVSRFHR